MKSHYIVLLIIAVSLDGVKAQEKKSQSTNQPTQKSPLIFNLSVNTANKAHIDQQNNLEQQAHHLSQQKTNVKTSVENNKDHDFLQKLYELYRQESKRVHDNSTSFLAWIECNKLKTCGISLLAIYSCMTYQMYTANLIINDPNSWSNWHNGKSLEDLFSTPQEALESGLLFAIQTKYVHPINPTDFIYSIVQSSISLKKEIEIVHNQITRYEWIDKCRCLPLFFIETKDIESLKDRHRKLLFIQHLLASWCARYKIDKNH